MRVLLALITVTHVVGFAPPGLIQRPAFRLGSSTDAKTDAPSSTKKKTGKILGLLTFDLDDSLYPLDTVIQEANEAFARAMESYGFTGIKPSDIDETGKRIREELALKDPEAAAELTHTEVRILAIRQVMEKTILDRKLKETAKDWATEVEYLTDIVVKSANQWAKMAVSPSVVNAVYTAWEMERYHSAERNLYPEVLDVLRKIKEDHPSVIIGAVTDGKANPMLMTFTLAPYFDFCMSWEDDQGARRKFFKELTAAESNAELTWIYDAAKDMGKKLAYAAAELTSNGQADPRAIDPDSDNVVWIHVGDDLAYDIGGSAACGAKTIYLELDEKYKQSNRLRFDGGPQPSWATSSEEELSTRRKMNEAAMEHVNAKIAFLTRLPEAIEDILEETN